jgi:hypothetical protein
MNISMNYYRDKILVSIELHKFVTVDKDEMTQFYNFYKLYNRNIQNNMKDTTYTNL